MEPAEPERISSAAKLFIASVGLAGLTGMAVTFLGWTGGIRPRFVVYLIAALISTGMKLPLPGVNGTISLNFVLIMLGLTELQPAETLCMAVASVAAQNCWKMKGGVRPVHVFFNTTGIALAVLAANWIYHRPWMLNVPEGEFLRLTLAGVAYFLVNVVPVAIVVALTRGQNIRTVVESFSDWTFSYYLVGVSLAEVMHKAAAWLGWTFALALLPPLYVTYRSVRLYFAKMGQEKAHAESMASLHLRTIEALATAIEAKDECTGDHLRRVQVYSLELAKYLDLPPDQVSALQAASILHDIGKLAVPDYIISKPGRLTPDEFEKMKAHTVVGAEILEQVGFPYPVSPIVRSHHEKWDGSGYPDGLKAENIPIGARILSAVDCLDALASDRQYRRALPLNEAMDYVAGLSARSFDPRVIDVLKANYQKFERLAQNAPLRNHRLSKDVVVSRGEAPDAGFEKSAVSTEAAGTALAVGAAAGADETNGTAGVRLENPADAIAEARQQMRAVGDLAMDLSAPLSMQEVLSLLAESLKQLVPYDCLAVYVREKSFLKARYTHGLESVALAGLEIPVGEGLSGWVVQNGKAIINGNPAVEPGYVAATGQPGALNSALSIPLGEEVDHISGALTLYRTEPDAYNVDHLQVLMAIKVDIARALEGAFRVRGERQGSAADELTGLPTKEALLAYLQDGFAAQRRAVTLLLLDIAQFRRVNERFGHRTGDELLKRVADIAGANCRSGDYVARAGGDEFVLLLSAARPEELAGRIDSLDRLVANACRGLCGEETSGLDAGVACFPENGPDASSLLSFAEQSLAHAKEARQARRNAAVELDQSLGAPA